MVSGEYQNIVRIVYFNDMKILVDRIGRTHVPELAQTLLRGKQFDEFVQFGRKDIPCQTYMPLQRSGFILCQYIHPAKPGIHAIADGKIDDAVYPTERNRGLRAVFGQRPQPFTLTAGHNECQHILEHE
jgi:hypothetical protein